MRKNTTMKYILSSLSVVFLTSCFQNFDSPLCNHNTESILDSNNEYVTAPDEFNQSVKIGIKQNEVGPGYTVQFEADQPEKIVQIVFCRINGDLYAETTNVSAERHDLFQVKLGEWKVSKFNSLLRSRTIGLNRVNFSENKLQLNGIEYVKTVENGFTVMQILNSSLADPRDLFKAFYFGDEKSTHNFIETAAN